MSISAQAGTAAPARAHDVPRAAGVARAGTVAAALGRTARRFPLTLCVLVALTAARTSQDVDPSLASRLEWDTSTTIPQMVHHPLRVFVGSVPWLTGASLPLWLLLVVVAVGGLEAAVGTGTALAIVMIGHVGATLVSEGVLGLRVATGRLPSSALDVLDVGPSYVVACALTATMVLANRRSLRMVAGLVLAVVAPDLVSGVTRWDLDGVGHTSAFVLGLLAGAVLIRRRRRHLPGTRRRPGQGTDRPAEPEPDPELRSSDPRPVVPAPVP
ncbi:rhomboid-like protein [Frankia sp. AgB32]|uniref:rhomboid-like protein n=1 Tax=Frankia sp. AgB32 TaxID=631119 RepID=UPI00200F0820|nr:rhomboid-like protein [Frankia sp. AgB32]MCK9895736.1 hypothetical protein [Frankia sp. AgB32]